VIDPSHALQVALYAALMPVEGVGARVYDAVPDDRAFPYVTIGAAQTIPARAECVDGTESFVDVHIWSREVGSIEAKVIGGRVLLALHDASLELEGHRLIAIRFTGSRVFRDPDGITTHGVYSFRVLSQPE
jgi:hypothetical protein